MTSPQSTSAPAEGVCSSSADRARLWQVLGAFYKTVDVMKSARNGETKLMSVWPGDMKAVEDVMLFLENLRDQSSDGGVEGHAGNANPTNHRESLVGEASKVRGAGIKSGPSDLLPCPLCGEKHISLNKPGFNYKKGSINCPACLLTLPGEVNEDELIKCWNDRAPQPVSDAAAACPRPFNDGPQDLTAAECVSKGQCGCGAGAQAEKPCGEPVAWSFEVEWGDGWARHVSFHKPSGNKYQRNIQPLYASPVPSSWQPIETKLRNALEEIAAKNDLSGIPDDELQSAAFGALHECECIARNALALPSTHQPCPECEANGLCARHASTEGK